MILSRRNALRGLFLAAPAIVAAPSLMRVSADGWDVCRRIAERLDIAWRDENGQYHTVDAKTGKPLDTVADYRALSNG